MKVCILVPAVNVEKVPDTALTIPLFIGESRDKLLNIALSENGQEPATYYFCVVNVSEAAYQKLLTAKKYSEMSTDNPKDFLKSKNLKVIYPKIVEV